MSNNFYPLIEFYTLNGQVLPRRLMKTHLRSTIQGILNNVCLIEVLGLTQQ